MSNAPSDNDLIERYLLGKLTDAEIRSFEIRLGDDREFARKYRLLSTFPEMMSDEGRLEFDKNKAEAELPVLKKKTHRFQNRRYFLWGGISIILLTGLGLFFLQSGKETPKESIPTETTVTPKTNIAKPAVPPSSDTVKPKSDQQASETSRDMSIRPGGDMSVQTGGAQKAFELLIPAEDSKFTRNETIVFNWKQKTDTFTRFYIISVLDDQVVFWRGVRLGNREFKVPGSYLFPGKYYWYVGTKEQKRTFIVSE